MNVKATLFLHFTFLEGKGKCSRSNGISILRLSKEFNARVNSKHSIFITQPLQTKSILYEDALKLQLVCLIIFFWRKIVGTLWLSTVLKVFIRAYNFHQFNEMVHFIAQNLVIYVKQVYRISQDISKVSSNLMYLWDVYMSSNN